MESNSENEDINTVKVEYFYPELPEKSRKKYEAVFKLFMDWRTRKKVHSFSEKVLLAYFVDLSKKYKSSSLWSHYSMIKSTMKLNGGIDIGTYSELISFLKRKAAGFQPKKAKTFSSDQIQKFINEAPDDRYLATKVGLIMGIMGACRAREMYEMKTEHLQDLGTAMLVTVPNAKSVRKFTITDNFYNICKKYLILRPGTIHSNYFFYQKNQKMGINKFTSMWKQIAIFLKLPNPEEYSRQSFHRSSYTLCVDGGGEITAFKRHVSLPVNESCAGELRTIGIKDHIGESAGTSHTRTSEAIYVDESRQTFLLESEDFIDESMKTCPSDTEDGIDESMRSTSEVEDSIDDLQRTCGTESSNDKSMSTCTSATKDCNDDLIRTCTSTTENHILDSIKTEIDTEDDTHETEQEKTTFRYLNKPITINNESLAFDVGTVPILHFTNCSNITIYFNNKKMQ